MLKRHALEPRNASTIWISSAVHPAAKWVPINMDRDDIVCGSPSS